MKRYFAALFTIVLLLSGCRAAPQKETSTTIAMGTVVSQTIYSTGENEAIKKIQSLTEQLESDFLSTHIEGSELQRINAETDNGDGIILSESMYNWLEKSLEVGASSKGALDITLGELIALWNIDALASEGKEPERIPDDEEIIEALDACGLDKLKLQKDGDVYKLYKEGKLTLHLGAVGKGIVLDEIKAILEKEDNVCAGVISVGGSVYTYGNKPEGGNWVIGVTDPIHPGESIGKLSLPGGYCVSTSGDYERYFEYNGVKYHHILDGTTGYPAQSGVKSVTIVSEDGFLTDALSTACFVLGATEGKKLAEQYGAEALFVLSDGTYEMTEHMSKLFTANM